MEGAIAWVMEGVFGDGRAMEGSVQYLIVRTNCKSFAFPSRSSVTTLMNADVLGDRTPLRFPARREPRENPPNQDEVYGGHETLSDSAPRQSHNGRRSRERCGSPAAITSGVRPAAAPRTAGPPSGRTARRI